MIATIDSALVQAAEDMEWLKRLDNGKRPSGADKTSADMQFIADIPYAERNGQPLLLDLARPKTSTGKKLPVLVYIHGGGWKSGSRKSIPDPFWLLPGYIKLSIDYRLSGTAPFPAQLEDCRDAVRWLRANAHDLGAAPDRIGVWGSSAGGHLACLMGLTDDVQAVISCSGPTNLPELEEWQQSLTRLMSGKLNGLLETIRMRSPLLIRRPVGWLLDRLSRKMLSQLSASSLEALVGCTPAQDREAWKQASPLYRLGQAEDGTASKTGSPAYLLMHGTTDPIVPIYQSVSFYQALKASGREAVFVPLAGHGHSTFWDHTGRFRKETMALAARFLEQHL